MQKFFLYVSLISLRVQSERNENVQVRKDTGKEGAVVEMRLQAQLE